MVWLTVVGIHSANILHSANRLHCANRFYCTSRLHSTNRLGVPAVSYGFLSIGGMNSHNWLHSLGVLSNDTFLVDICQRTEWGLATLPPYPPQNLGENLFRLLWHDLDLNLFFSQMNKSCAAERALLCRFQTKGENGQWVRFQEIF